MAKSVENLETLLAKRGLAPLHFVAYVDATRNLQVVLVVRDATGKQYTSTVDAIVTQEIMRAIEATIYSDHTQTTVQLNEGPLRTWYTYAVYFQTREACQRYLQLVEAQALDLTNPEHLLSLQN